MLKDRVKQISKLVALTAGLALAVSGCGSGEAVIADKTAQESSASISDFNYVKETSKSYLVFNGDMSTKTDVSKYITNYKGGDLFINEDGLEKLFGLTESETSEALIKQYDEEEKDNSLASDPDGAYLYFTNDSRSFLFKEGSKLYLADGQTEMLSAVVVKQDDGHYSFPLMNIIFDFGYDTVGTSIKGNSVIYSLNSQDPLKKDSVAFESKEYETAETQTENNEENTEVPAEQVLESETVAEGVE